MLELFNLALAICLSALVRKYGSFLKRDMEIGINSVVEVEHGCNGVNERKPCL